jgi:hypothetical protein
MTMPVRYRSLFGWTNPGVRRTLGEKRQCAKDVATRPFYTSIVEEVSRLEAGRPRGSSGVMWLRLTYDSGLKINGVEAGRDRETERRQAGLSRGGHEAPMNGSGVIQL